MGVNLLRCRQIFPAITFVGVFAACAGCQSGPRASQQRLIAHQAMIDFSGLKPAESFEHVKVRAAVPRTWTPLTPQSGPMYTHQQWKSPSTFTGLGVAHVSMPLPINTRLLLWLAKREYTKKANDGKVIAEWTDDLGRPWFEAENTYYRVRGYVVVRGFEACVVYFGRKVGHPPDPGEMSLAARAADSILPGT